MIDLVSLDSSLQQIKTNNNNEKRNFTQNVAVSILYRNLAIRA